MNITIRKATKLIRDKVGNLLKINNDGSINTVTKPESKKCELFSKIDLYKEFTWQEIDGVRRIIQIDFTSELFNNFYRGYYTLRRRFTYQTIDPYDLININEVWIEV